MVRRNYPLPADSPSDTVLIVHPDHPHDEGDLRGRDYKIAEIESLTKAIRLEHLQTVTAKINRIQPSTYLGKGKCEEIRELTEALEPNVIVFNAVLSPVQQRNLEKLWRSKVIDRTGLILEIFGDRAQTKEGRLQVELAALDYQKSRLVRSWTHLERQRGGAGFMGGPGETQIELDRRIISDKITKLKTELENVKRMREMGRKSRERMPFPVVAFVGYTNAGKSTLFNTLTGAEVFAKDLLFATLDPTLRRFDLPNGSKAILSDTVGFISDLPTHLIAAFRATLEETLHADVIVHVIDASSPDHKAQRADVIKILRDLDIDYEADERIIEVYNKIDAVNEDDLAELTRDIRFSHNKLMISAVKSLGIDVFLAKVHEIISKNDQIHRFLIKSEDGKALAWLYEHADVLERSDSADAAGEAFILVDVKIAAADLLRFTKRFEYEPILDSV
ncbi:MAG: GTPase HflX [Alphaproteobacteria bacterium]